MSYHGYGGPPPRRPESPWAKTSTIAAVVGVIVAVVAAYFAYLAIPDHSSPNPSTSRPAAPATQSVAPPADDPVSTADPPPTAVRSGPALAVDPVVVRFGDDVSIVGSGFEAADGLQVRLFRSDSISYPIGPDEIVADGNGRFTIQGAVDNQGWCGSGTVAVFHGSGSALGPPPPLADAVATGQLGVLC